MDADSTRGKDAQKAARQFDAADCAVLLGTQMIAKGLDFPEVTLVGVVNADFALKLPDFRAGSAPTICWSRLRAAPVAAIAPARLSSRPTFLMTRSSRRRRARSFDLYRLRPGPAPRRPVSAVCALGKHLSMVDERG
ncbi:MAG: helicase-related protein [Collinsella sp.]